MANRRFFTGIKTKPKQTQFEPKQSHFQNDAPKNGHKKTPGVLQPGAGTFKDSSVFYLVVNL